MASSTVSATPTTGLYEPLQPPPHPITETDRGGYALLAAVVMTVIAGLTTCVKLQITLATFRKLRRDDCALVVALVTALGYTIATCGAVHYGLGRVATILSDSQLQSLSQYYHASNILLFVSLMSSKIAVALLIIAVQPDERIAAAMYGLVGTIAVWGIAAVLVVALQCSPTRWSLGPTEENTCINQLSAQVGLRVVDIITDIALAVSPALMMIRVQMSMDKRLIVALMFGLRLVYVSDTQYTAVKRNDADNISTPILTALSLVSLTHYYSKPTADRPFALVNPSIWTSVTVSVSLITACLPSIKRFLKDWAAGATSAPMLDAFELQISSNNPTYGRGSGLRSFVRSMPRSKGTSKLEGSELNQSRTRDDKIRSEDDAGSRRGLTDGIVQTVDFRIEYEEQQEQ